MPDAFHGSERLGDEDGDYLEGVTTPNAFHNAARTR